jgi:hypothetical protein
MRILLRRFKWLSWRRAGAENNIPRILWIAGAIGLVGITAASVWATHTYGLHKVGVAANNMARQLWGQSTPGYVVTVQNGNGTVSSAPPMTVTLTASPSSPFVGQSVTLTAATDEDIDGYALDILDQTTGQWVGTPATSGTTDTATVSSNAPGSHTYVAYVGDPDSTNVPVAKSAPLTVTWRIPFTVSLQASAQTLVVGQSVTLTATVNQDVAPYALDILDQTTGQWVAGPVRSGSSLSATLTQNTAGSHTYVAYVGDAKSTSGALAQSSAVTVTWQDINVQLSGEVTNSYGNQFSWTVSTNTPVDRLGDYATLLDQTTGQVVGTMRQGSSQTFTTTITDGQAHTYVANLYDGQGRLLRSSNTLTAHPGYYQATGSYWVPGTCTTTEECTTQYTTVQNCHETGYGWCWMAGDPNWPWTGCGPGYVQEPGSMCCSQVACTTETVPVTTCNPVTTCTPGYWATSYTYVQPYIS